MIDRKRQHFKLFSALLTLTFFLVSLDWGSDIAWCLDQDNAHLVKNERLQLASCHSAGTTIADANHTGDNPPIPLKENGNSCLDISLTSLCAASQSTSHDKNIVHLGILENALSADAWKSLSLYPTPQSSQEKHFQPLELRTKRTVVLLV